MLNAHARRLRLTRNLTIAFAALTVASVVIGSPLVVIGGADPPKNKPAMVDGGIAILSIGAAALVGTAVSFGLWLHERHR
jgi:hypothetical protein